MGGDPDFEDLYRAADDDLGGIPWASCAPRPELVAWLDQSGLATGRCLVVACGVGDDAEELARRGFSVDAFDVAPTAIALCRRRFPDSSVRYRVGDLFELPGSWTRAFDLVVEIHTLQSVPEQQLQHAVAAIASTLAPHGVLFLRALAREPDERSYERPWPLTRDDLAQFAMEGLTELDLVDEPATDTTSRHFQLTAQR